MLSEGLYIPSLSCLVVVSTIAYTRSRKTLGKQIQTCTGSCVGHYIFPERNWELVKVNGPVENKPVRQPRQILGDFCKKNTGFLEDVQNFARKCLLSEEDVKIWLTNIQTIKSCSKKKQKKKKKPVDEGACTLGICIMHAGYIIPLYNY